MVLKKRINDDLKTALMGGNRLACEVLRGLKAVILNQELADGVRETGLADDKIEKLIAQEVKKRRESAEIYASANRPELADKELAELEILMAYLPKQLTEVEIRDLIQQVVKTEKIEPSSQNVGRLIGAVKQRAGSSADGAIVAKLVQEIIKK